MKSGQPWVGARLSFSRGSRGCIVISYYAWTLPNVQIIQLADNNYVIGQYLAGVQPRVSVFGTVRHENGHGAERWRLVLSGRQS